MGFKLPSKKIAVAALALGISLIGVFFNAQPTQAATYRWINRQDILSSDNVVFRDVNTMDKVVEYEEQSPRACHSRINFSGFLNEGSTSPEWDLVHKFYYSNDIYNSKAKRSLVIAELITTGAGQTQCTNQPPQDNVNIGDIDKRRVVFYKDAATDTIVNIIGRQTFIRKGDFNGSPRYFLDSELSPAEHCPDAIILKTADADYDDFWGGPPVGGSSMLYAVREDSNLGRPSSSYNTVNPPNGGGCRVESERLATYSMLAYGKGGANNADNILAANGLNADGSYIGGNKDAFLFFLGTAEANIPPTSAVQLPPPNQQCQVPGKESLPKDNPNCAGDQPQVCTVSEDGLANALAWIICPITDAISKATVFIEEHLIMPYLTVNPLSTDPSAPNGFAYTVWDSFRNVANVLFIVAFFVLIFSQATGVGISSYGIKRLLPRLIIVAVAANLSFFIVAFLIDVFNLIGQGIGTLLMNTVIRPTPEMLSDPTYNAVASGPNKWQYITLIGGALIAGFLTSGAALSWIFPLLLLAAFVVFIAVVALIIRQLLILLLVVLSPIAFVAWLLPNTEKYFSRWGSLLFNLLLMYPFIILLFALGKVLGQFFATNQVDLSGFLGFSPTNTVAGVLQSLGHPAVASYSTADEVVRVIAQFLANVLPLVFIPGLIVTTNKLVSSATGFVKNGLTKAGSGAKGAYDKSAFGQFRKKRADERSARVAAGNYRGRGGWVNPRNIKSASNRRRNQSALFNAATGGYGANRAVMDRALRAKEREDVIRDFGGDTGLARAWALSGGNEAALDGLIASGVVDGATYGRGTAGRMAFSQLRGSGRHRSSESFMAAQQMLANEGEGDMSTLVAAQEAARRLGASQIDIASLGVGSVAGWRGKGRGDIQNNVDPVTGRAAAGAAPTGTGGWGAIRMENLTRHALDTPAKQADFATWYGASDDHSRAVLTSLSKMEGRARTAAVAALGGDAFVESERTRLGVTI